MRLAGGDVDVTAGTGFRGDLGEIVPLVRLTVSSAGRDAFIWLTPLQARFGLDLIGAAHSSLADTILRTIAKRHGLDGDALIGELRELTDDALGPG